MPKKSVKKSAKKTVKKPVKKVTRNVRAGRPSGSGKYGGCETKVIRVPVFLEREIQEFVIQKLKSNNSARSK
ncbi:MAG: hypothetical protein LBC02_09245 [Planctomycetaceae bacterium]|jgi:hypothetical protein|nr:hypothetical protein [Planctomycetaceae bacterium]